MADANIPFDEPDRAVFHWDDDDEILDAANDAWARGVAIDTHRFLTRILAFWDRFGLSMWTHFTAGELTAKFDVNSDEANDRAAIGWTITRNGLADFTSCLSGILGQYGPAVTGIVVPVSSVHYWAIRETARVLDRGELPNNTFGSTMQLLGLIRPFVEALRWEDGPLRNFDGRLCPFMHLARVSDIVKEWSQS